MSDAKLTLKQKAYRELKQYLAIAAYLWLVLGLFVLYKSVILSESQIPYIAHGEALLNALALAKVMLIADDLHLAERSKSEPLIYPTLFKSAVFAIVLGIFKILEEIGIGLYRGRSVVESFNSIGGGTLKGILTLVVLMAAMLVPFFGLDELSKVLGKNRLRQLFFGRSSANADPLEGSA